MMTFESANQNLSQDEDQDNLYKARIKTAEEYVEQAKVELSNATTEEEKTIWQNRVKQREKALCDVVEGHEDLAA